MYQIGPVCWRGDDMLRCVRRLRFVRFRVYHEIHRPHCVYCPRGRSQLWLHGTHDILPTKRGQLLRPLHYCRFMGNRRLWVILAKLALFHI